MVFDSRANIMAKLEEFKKLWADQTATRGYIRERIGCSYKDIEEVRKSLGLPDRQNSSHAISWEPSEAEIEAKKREIQESWTPDKRASRETGDSRQMVQLKNFHLNRRDMSFAQG